MQFKSQTGRASHSKHTALYVISHKQQQTTHMASARAFLLVMTVAALLRLLPSSVGVSDFIVEPFESSFGATVTMDVEAVLEKHSIHAHDFDRSVIGPDLEELVASIKRALHEHRFLYFPNQPGLDWSKQLAFLQLFSEAYDESSHVNRKKWAGEKDPRGEEEE